MIRESPENMLTVYVTLDVIPGKSEEFLVGLLANAKATRAEPGCLQFDVSRSTEVPHRYYLNEVYRNDDAFFVSHRESDHYPAWKQIVADCVVPGSHTNSYARPVRGVEHVPNGREGLNAE